MWEHQKPSKDSLQEFKDFSLSICNTLHRKLDICTQTPDAHQIIITVDIKAYLSDVPSSI